MEMREKKREKWFSFSPNCVLCLAIVSLLALSLVGRSSGYEVTQDARSLIRRSSTYYAQNVRRHPVRRRLSFGPGSFPPRCMYKCGRCAPCYPVHVPVPPGTLFFPTEYYPEAWRCKCGNRLYMP